MHFDYKLISQGSFTIVNFKGRMCKESREKMLHCLDELLKSQVQTVVLFFRDVKQIDFGILSSEVKSSLEEILCQATD